LQVCWREFARVNRRHFGGALPRPQIQLSDRFTARAGAFYPRTKTIALSWRYYLTWGLKELLGVLRHEIGHLAMPKEGHSRRFKALLQMLKAPRYSKPFGKSPYKYEWACPHCGATHWTRRRVVLACGSCCDRYNRGRFSPRYQLCLVQELSPCRVDKRRLKVEFKSPKPKRVRLT
jgi:predicted SprT family Zn-dependent metalloprotease